MRKKCTKCGVDKDNSEFPTSKVGRFGTRPDCRSCINKRSKEQYALNRDTMRLRARERERAKPQEYKAAKRKVKLRRAYGITPQDFDTMLQNCGGKCQCCGKCLDKPNLDHCHITGKIRGILCNMCNMGIGMLGDNLAGVEKAIAYLRDHSPE